MQIVYFSEVTNISESNRSQIDHKFHSYNVYPSSVVSERKYDSPKLLKQKVSALLKQCTKQKYF